MIYYDDLEAGQETLFGHYDVTREEVLEFARKYDPQPFHLSDEEAAKTHFGRLAASGWHTCAMTMAVIARHVVDTEQAGLGSPGVDELRWLKPVYPGDRLTVRGKVVETTPSRSKPHIGVIRSENTITNQDDVKVMTFTSIVLMLRRPERLRLVFAVVAVAVAAFRASAIAHRRTEVATALTLAGSPLAALGPFGTCALDALGSICSRDTLSLIGVLDPLGLFGPLHTLDAVGPIGALDALDLIDLLGAIHAVGDRLDAVSAMARTGTIDSVSAIGPLGTNRPLALDSNASRVRTCWFTAVGPASKPLQFCVLASIWRRNSLLLIACSRHDSQ